MARKKTINLTEEQWDEVVEQLALGRTWPQIGFKLGVPAGSLKEAGRFRGLGGGGSTGSMKPTVQYMQLSPTTNEYLGAGKVIPIDYADPEAALISVRERLMSVAMGIEKVLLDAGERDYMKETDVVSRFARHAEESDYGVAQYVSILKDVAKLAIAHMPYRHSTMASVAIKDMDKSNGIAKLEPKEKIRRLKLIMEQAGIVPPEEREQA